MTIKNLKSALKLDTFSKDKAMKVKSILKKSFTGRKTPISHIKFAGPIKILIIEPQAEYCRTVWCAVGVGLTQICVGAINLSVFHYSVMNGDSHATVCCLAFHFFSAEAILSLNYANGWSTPMRRRHRKLAHVLLQVCGVFCAVIGTVLGILAKGVSISLHGITGLVAAVLAGISVASGIAALIGIRPWLVTYHMSFGITAFIISSISLCSGILYKPFKDWNNFLAAFVYSGLSFACLIH